MGVVCPSVLHGNRSPIHKEPSDAGVWISVRRIACCVAIARAVVRRWSVLCGACVRGRGSCGVSAPRDAVLLFRQRDPKPLAPGRGLRGAKRPGRMRCGPYDSDSPRPQTGVGTVAQPRPQAPGDGRHEMAGLQLQRITTRSFAALRMTEGEGFLVWHRCRRASTRPRTGTASSGFSHHRRHRLLLRLRSRLAAAALPWRCESTAERTSK